MDPEGQKVEQRVYKNEPELSNISSSELSGVGFDRDIKVSFQRDHSVQEMGEISENIKSSGIIPDINR